jgi:hypothetical protein
MSFSNEFVVRLGVTTDFNALSPALEWYCQQDTFCTYSSPYMKGASSPAVFADFSQYRGNLASLSPTTANEIILQDGSGLYDGTPPCSGDCEAIVYRYTNGRNLDAICPIGTELVVSASGTVSEIMEYIFTPSPRVNLVGEMPSTCLFVDSGYRCKSGEATLRFARVESPCDIASADDCPFPLVGRTYGTCAAEDPCPELN